MATPLTRFLRPQPMGVWRALAPGAPPLARWVMTALLRGADRVPFTPDTFTTSGIARRAIAQCVLGMQRDGWVDVEAHVGQPPAPADPPLDLLLERMAGESSLLLADQRGLPVARHRMAFPTATRAAAYARELQRLLAPLGVGPSPSAPSRWHEWQVGIVRFGVRTVVLGDRIFHLVTDRRELEPAPTASIEFAEALARRVAGPWPTPGTAPP